MNKNWNPYEPETPADVPVPEDTDVEAPLDDGEVEELAALIEQIRKEKDADTECEFVDLASLTAELRRQS